MNKNITLMVVGVLAFLWYFNQIGCRTPKKIMNRVQEKNISEKLYIGQEFRKLDAMRYLLIREMEKHGLNYSLKEPEKFEGELPPELEEYVHLIEGQKQKMVREGLIK